MSPKTFDRIFRLALVPLTATVLVATGCTGSMSTTTGTQSSSSGPAFLIGTDAPLAAVVSMQVTLQDVELTNGTNTTATLVKGTPTVDFARYNGLQGLVDMVDVPAGTYTGVTFVLCSGTVSWLSTGSGAPTIQSASAAFSNTTVTVQLPNPLVVGDKTPPVGVRLDFDLGKSIPTSGGQIETNSSGDVVVNPTFDITTVARGDQGAHVDELIGGLVSGPTSTTEPSSFVIQGPHGENFTINTSSTTEWDGGSSLSSLNSNSVVAVAGVIDPSDQTLDADEVDIISDKGFYAGGPITYVTPSSGQATDMQMYVRGTLPSQNSNVPLGGIANVTITGNENYGIYWMHNAFTDLLFNASALAPGQEITVGGPDPTASPFTVNRIHLHNRGYNGTIVAGSQNSGQGTFTMQVTGFMGQLITTNVVVYLGPQCDFRYGLGGFTDLTDSTSIRVVGLLLKNSTNGQLVLLARHIDGTEFTDFTTAAWQ
ncbi:MAG: DUF4382 domain-containing protein [Terracidiphilus sp.]